MEQAKAQEVAQDSWNFVHNSVGRYRAQSSKALVREGEIPPPTSMEIQRSCEVTKTIQALIQRLSRADRGCENCRFVGLPGTGKTSLGQSIPRTLGRPFQPMALSGVRDELRSAATAGHMLPAGLVCSHRHRVRLVTWIPLLFYCGSHILALHFSGVDDNRDKFDKVGQSNCHGDPAAALLEVLDPEQNVAFNVQHSDIISPDTTRMTDRITTLTCRSIHRRFSLFVSLIPSIQSCSHSSIGVK